MLSAIRWCSRTSLVRSGCEFRYALTKSGDVVGSRSCYEQSVQPHRLMLMSMQYGTDTLWTLATKENGQLAMDLYSIR